MTDLADPVVRAVSPTSRLDPIVFAHARVAMLTSTTSGVVVEVNAVAAALLGRHRHELVQEPIGRHVSLLSGHDLPLSLSGAACAEGPQSLGHCSVQRRAGGDAVMELVVSSGCRASGRDLMLLQLVPLDH